MIRPLIRWIDPTRWTFLIMIFLKISNHHYLIYLLVYIDDNVDHSKAVISTLLPTLLLISVVFCGLSSEYLISVFRYEANNCCCWSKNFLCILTYLHIRALYWHIYTSIYQKVWKITHARQTAKSNNIICQM